MFIGRQRELDALERQWNDNRFTMIVLYGRRRVGKTALAQRFCANKRTLWFTAQEQSDTNNLMRFSAEIYRFFGFPTSMPAMTSWEAAFDFILEQTRTRGAGDPYVLVFDEFPYAAAAQPALPSMMQIAIDHGFLNTNVTMILSGSNEGFMESKVLGYRSPLYGRRTAQIRLKPFDIFDASLMLPGVSPETVMEYYAALGGTPYYLQQIDTSLGFAENLAKLCFSTSGLLYDEPMMLLRQELREPMLYNSLLGAIGTGATKRADIAAKAGIPVDATSAYLQRLTDLGLIEREVPFGTNPARSKKGLWRFSDPFFAYWHRFIGPATTAIENGQGEGASHHATSGPAFDTYVGQQFEDVCKQWMWRHAQDVFSMLPKEIGRWWGGDPKTRQQTDIDIVAGDIDGALATLGECKWRNDFNESDTIATLKDRVRLIEGYRQYRFALFTKRPCSQATRRKVADDPTLELIDMPTMLEQAKPALQTVQSPTA